MLSRLFDDGVEIIEVGFIVPAGSGVFNCLPGDQEAQEIEPPGAQAAEMLIRLLQREGAPHKADAVRVEEAVGVPGGAVGGDGHLAAAPQVDAPQQDNATIVIDEVIVANLVHGKLPVEWDGMVWSVL